MQEIIILALLAMFLLHESICNCCFLLLYFRKFALLLKEEHLILAMPKRAGSFGAGCAVTKGSGLDI